MSYNQEAYDAECAAPERVTVFMNARAAIGRAASEEPGPDYEYALQARKIAVLRRAAPDITIEIW